MYQFNGKINLKMSNIIRCISCERLLRFNTNDNEYVISTHTKCECGLINWFITQEINRINMIIYRRKKKEQKEQKEVPPLIGIIVNSLNDEMCDMDQLLDDVRQLLEY